MRVAKNSSLQEMTDMPWQKADKIYCFFLLPTTNRDLGWRLDGFARAPLSLKSA